MSDMIVTLINNEINIVDGKIFFHDADLVAQHGSINKFRTYKININNFEYALMCPEIVTESNEKMVIWPSIKLPYRKYPVYVYIYAAALYLSTNKSMRIVALEVRRKFGLEKFSHSTVSRSIRKLGENLNILMTILSPNEKDTELSKRNNWSEEKTDQFSNLFKIISPILSDNQTSQYGSFLNYQFFTLTGKFPI